VRPVGLLIAQLLDPRGQHGFHVAPIATSAAIADRRRIIAKADDRQSANHASVRLAGHVIALRLILLTVTQIPFVTAARGLDLARGYSSKRTEDALPKQAQLVVEEGHVAAPGGASADGS
jgi:hypothetical protein